MNLIVQPYKLSANSYVQKKSPSFCAHPDFYALRRNYDVTASSYFRRGQAFGSPCDSFADIVMTFSKIFSRPFIKPQKMLIAGIGDSQEVFSYLAVIKRMLNQANIKDSVDLNIIDLQSKPTDKNLRINSFYDHSHAPDRFAQDSFIKDTTDYGQKWYQEYRVKDDIFELVKDTYRNKKKSKWNSRVQEAIKSYDDESFDIISSNNTLGYIRDEKQIYETLRQMYRCLKRGGYLIVDPHYTYIAKAGLSDKFSYIFDGIYQKL